MKYLLLGILLAMIFSAVVKGEEYGAPVIADTVPEETPTATPAALVNPKCTKVMTTDGANGFLWKAVDTTGKLAILFPASFIGGFEEVRVMRVWKFVGGQPVYRKRPVLDKCVVGGFGNGDRQHARCPYSGAYYDGHVYAEDGAQVCEWVVACPSMRQD